MKAKGPGGHILFGAGVEYKKDPLGFLLETAAQYPEISSFRFGPMNMHLLSNPDYIQYVLKKNYKNYSKGPKVKELRHFLGNSMTIADGEEWRRQRKMAQPAFMKERIQKMAETMIKCTDKFVENWKKRQMNENVEMVTEMKKLTLDIIGETLFSKDISRNSKQIAKFVTHLINHINIRMQNSFNFPIGFPFGGRDKFKENLKSLDALIYKIIAERKKSKESYHDLLAIWMEAKDETGSGLSDKQVRDEIITFFLTGSESSAVLFSWISYLLANDKSTEAKLRDEITLVGKGKFKAEHISKLPYTKSIIEEAIRLYPPIWVFTREAINDDNIAGYKINRGDVMLISPYVMNRSQKFWKKPEDFIPERFYKENRKNIDPHIYIPFGDGPRGCIGDHFAIMELQIMLAVFYQNFTFSYERNGNLDMEIGFNLRPKNGIVMKPHLL